MSGRGKVGAGIWHFLGVYITHLHLHPTRHQSFTASCCCNQPSSCSAEGQGLVNGVCTACTVDGCASCNGNAAKVRERACYAAKPGLWSLSSLLPWNTADAHAHRHLPRLRAERRPLPLRPPMPSCLQCTACAKYTAGDASFFILNNGTCVAFPMDA